MSKNGIKKNEVRKKRSFYLDNRVIADFYCKKDKSKELEYFKDFKKEYKRLIDFFGVQPPKIKIKFVYSRKEMNEYWGSKSKISAMVDSKNPYLVYIFSPLVFEKSTNHKKKDMLTIIIHEAAHVFVSQINKRCFAWINEGICSFVEKKNLYNNVVKNKNWQWFKENDILINPNISWPEPMDYEGYKISYNLIKYIIKRHSKKTVFDLLKIKRIKDKNIKSKMKKILKDDYNKFMANFERALNLR